MRSSIDMGSNSVLLLIGEVQGQKIDIKHDESRVTSLGKDLDVNKAFIQESMDKTYQALFEYKNIIDGCGLLTSDTIITATEASRVATNAKDFFAKIKNDLGFTIKLISGAGEAYYTGRGISLSSQKENERLIVDLGGASTELIKIKTNPFEIINSVSLPLGSVRGQDWIEKGILKNKIENTLEKFDLSEFSCGNPLFVAGTMTSFACVMKGLSEFDGDEINGQVFSIKEFERVLKETYELGDKGLLSHYPYLGKRSRTLAAGGSIIKALNKIIGVKTLEISILGLRHGTLFEGAINERYLTS